MGMQRAQWWPLTTSSQSLSMCPKSPSSLQPASFQFTHHVACHGCVWTFQVCTQMSAASIPITIKLTTTLVKTVHSVPAPIQELALEFGSRCIIALRGGQCPGDMDCYDCIDRWLWSAMVCPYFPPNQWYSVWRLNMNQGAVPPQRVRPWNWWAKLFGEELHSMKRTVILLAGKKFSQGGKRKKKSTCNCGPQG